MVNLAPTFSIWLVVKLMMLVGLFLYLAFSVIVVRQVVLMSKTLIGEFGDILRLISWVHLILTMAILLLAMVFL